MEQATSNQLFRTFSFHERIVTRTQKHGEHFGRSAFWNSLFSRMLSAEDKLGILTAGENIIGTQLG